MGGPARIDGKFFVETDNFFICSFKIANIKFISSEHYFQWAKCINDKDRDFVQNAKSAMESWSRGNRIKLRKYWDSIRVEKMYDGNFAKFQQNNDLKTILTSTKGEITCRGSTGFWNKWNAKILTRIREELREDEKKNQKLIDSIKLEMKEFKEKTKKKLLMKEKQQKE